MNWACFHTQLTWTSKLSATRETWKIIRTCLYTRDMNLSPFGHSKVTASLCIYTADIVMLPFPRPKLTCLHKLTDILLSPNRKRATVSHNLLTHTKHTHTHSHTHTNIYCETCTESKYEPNWLYTTIPPYVFPRVLFFQSRCSEILLGN